MKTEGEKMGKHWMRLISVLFVWMCLCGAATAQTEYDAIWTNGTTGDWDVAGNWSTSAFPNNGTDTYNVIIDSNGGQNSTVTLNTNVAINDLTIDLGDSLIQNNASSLTLNGYVTNNGIINLNSIDSRTYLIASGGAVTLSGAGDLVLGGNVLNYLIQSGGGSFINDVNHTIRGYGRLITPIENRNRIIADNGNLGINSTITNATENDTIEVTAGNTLGIGPSASITGGQVNADGGTLDVYGTISGGQVNAFSGSTVNLGNDGTINDTLNIDADSVVNVVAVGSDSGYLHDAINNEGTFNVNNASTLCSNDGTIYTNNGVINLNSTGDDTSLTASDGMVTLSGSGDLVLGGNINNYLSQSGDGSFINDVNHTIRGGGQINADIANRNRIIADNGTLRINSTITNATESDTVEATGGNILDVYGTITGGQVNANGSTLIVRGTISGSQVNAGGGILDVRGIISGGQVNAVSGNTVNLSNDGTINSTLNIAADAVVNVVTGYSGHLYDTINNEGTIYVNSGSTLWSNDGTIYTNNGIINLNSIDNRVYLRATGGVVTLSGAGELVMGGNGYNYLSQSQSGDGSFINDVNHTIRGGGQINAPIENNGTIVADNGNLLVNSNISGNGNVAIANNATLDINQNLETGDLSMEAGTTLDVANNMTIDLNGHFTFAQTDESKWMWGADTSLAMSGEGDLWQSLEIGGEDLGLVSNGFTDNFDLENLIIEGDGTYAYLADLIDNGNGPLPEALYVDDLDVLTAAILNLNGLNLYTYLEGEIHLVTAGEGYLFGGGTIIDSAVPIPSAVWLLGSGLIGLVGIRRKFIKA